MIFDILDIEKRLNLTKRAGVTFRFLDIESEHISFKVKNFYEQKYLQNRN